MSSKYRFVKADQFTGHNYKGKVWFRIERVEVIGNANSFENATLIVDALNKKEHYESVKALMAEREESSEKLKAHYANSERQRITHRLNHLLTCYTGWCDGKARHVINYIINHIVKAT